MMTRRQILFSSSAALSARGAQAAARRPNIVFLMADDLGVGDLSCYGQKKFSTPNIDALATEGMQFQTAYAGCTVCAPSRSVLMTGKHMGHTSVRGNTGGQSLAPEDVTVAQLLQQAGYATGGFGKWGLGDIGTDGVPWRKGFDEFFGYLNQVHAHWFYPRFLMDSDKRYYLQGNVNGVRQTYSHDVIAERALSFIERNHRQPFFCYVPFTIPHWELLVPESSLRKYRGKFEESPMTGNSHYADQEIPRATYAAMIDRMDGDVGRILALLKRLNIDDNTIVFFTSDNGAATPLYKKENYFQSTMGLRGHKQNLYEGGIRTPLLARWPGKIKAGSQSGQQTYFADVLPTLCSLAGLEAPMGLDGNSILPTLTGQSQQAQHPYLYWEQPRYDARTETFRKELPMQALRAGNMKLIRPLHDAPLELYDLAADPLEQRNLAASQPGELARLENLLRSARTEPRPLKSPSRAYWDE
jgi:arylsulfatase A